MKSDVSGANASTAEPTAPDLAPPVELEDRVVDALRSRGLIASTTNRENTMSRTHALWATAAAVLMVVGIGVGRVWPVAPETSEDGRPQFALMLYEDSGYRVAQPGEDRVAEYRAWAQKLAQQGHLVDGAKLEDQGLMLSSDVAQAESGIPVSAAGVLAGYFVIRAADRAEAEQIVRDCPHLKYGGTVSLRRIEA